MLPSQQLPFSFGCASTQLTASGFVVLLLLVVVVVYIENENAVYGEQRTREGKDQGKTHRYDRRHGHSRPLRRYKELR